MERDIKRSVLARYSAPVHVQDFRLLPRRKMGFEGANVIFDTWVHPLMMGLEEHLLAMFKDDSNSRTVLCRRIWVRGTPRRRMRRVQFAPVTAAAVVAFDIALIWASDAEKELRRFPIFVRRQGLAATPSASPMKTAWQP